MLIRYSALLLFALCCACQPMPDDSAVFAPLRFATYNTSLYSDEQGGLVRELETGSTRAGKIAAVLQQVRPEIVLMNEFDYDPQHRAADLFQQRYLEVAQDGGGEPLHYPYRYLAEVNTGVASGLDIDRDGQIGQSGREYGNDAWGYGLHPGQYAMLLLSKYRIDGASVRSFRMLKWNQMPDARRPVDPANGQPFWDDAIWSQLRLSSKSHWDVPVETPLGTVHVLASHPTPPFFDGAEKRNVARNHDELRLWREYLSGGGEDWLCDDQGRCGGLAADARFVIMGDLNNDPVDGNGDHSAIIELIEHPRVLRHPAPSSIGGAQTGGRYAASSLQRRGAPEHATSNFGATSGTLRLDYVLPSVGFNYRDGGVFWPDEASPEAETANHSDHYLVWAEVD